MSVSVPCMMLMTTPLMSLKDGTIAVSLGSLVFRALVVEGKDLS